MLYRTPKHSQLPSLRLILLDLGSPPLPVWSKAVGISTRTASRYVSADHAPLSVHLALYWISSWGIDAAYCNVANLLELERALRRAAESDAAALRRELARVVAVSDFGCANDPTTVDLAVRVERRARRRVGGL